MKNLPFATALVFFLLLVASLLPLPTYSTSSPAPSPSPAIFSISRGETKDFSLEQILGFSQDNAEVDVRGIAFASIADDKLTLKPPLSASPGAYFGEISADSSDFPLLVAVSDINTRITANFILNNALVEQGDSVKLYLDIKSFSTLPEIKDRELSIKYSMTDLDGKEVFTQTSQKTFSPSEPVFDTISLPSSIQPGKYFLIARITHGSQTIVSAENLGVTKKPLVPQGKVAKFAGITLAVIGILIILLLISLFLVKRNVDFIIKNQPKKLEQIYTEYIKTRKASDAVSKLRKQLDVLNSGRKLKVIGRRLHEKSSRRIYSVVRKIEHKYKSAPISSRSDEETARLKHELELIESAYRLGSIKKSHYDDAKKGILRSLRKKQGKK